MSGARPKFPLILQITTLQITLLCLLVVSPAYAAQQHVAGKSLVKQEPPAATPQPATPPTPLTLEQMPSSPPQVTFRNGQLTIIAQNSTLGEILRGVRKQTGALVEIPSNATERVVGQFGPGPARDVLASLLNGSHFNYVMLGSETNSNLVERVILISKPGSALESGSQPGASIVANQPILPQPGVQSPGSTPDEQAGEEMTGEEAPEEAGEVDQPDNQPNQPQDQQQGAQPAIKTPEQLLQELQRQQQMQQQIQQQQQQGSPQGFPTSPNPVPQPQPNQTPQ